MKKLLYLFLVAAIIITPILVRAAEYDITDNYVTDIEDNKYSTIVIARGNEIENVGDLLEHPENVACIAEAADGEMLASAVKFYLRDEPEDGIYTVLLGGAADSTAPDRLTFYIGSPIEFGDVQSAKVWKESDSIAFAWEDVDNINNYKSILIQVGEKVFGISLQDFETYSGSVSIGLKITDVENVDEAVKAYLSSNGIDSETLSIE